MSGKALFWESREGGKKKTRPIFVSECARPPASRGQGSVTGDFAHSRAGPATCMTWSESCCSPGRPWYECQAAKICCCCWICDSLRCLRPCRVAPGSSVSPLMCPGPNGWRERGCSHRARSLQAMTSSLVSAIAVICRKRLVYVLARIWK